jgi:hypothetical protein
VTRQKKRFYNIGLRGLVIRLLQDAKTQLQVNTLY